MALARNLQTKNKPKLKIPKLDKKWLWGGLFIVILLGTYGILNLSKVAFFSNEKQEIKYETGDRPLPQKTEIWVTAPGGLYMRETPDSKAKILILIPDGTKLESTQLEGEWYKVDYMNKTGWVNRKYLTTQAPAEDPTKGWNSIKDSNLGFSLRYPKDWVYVDYGPNPATSSISYLAFGPQLPPQLDPNNLPPVILRVSSQNKQQVEDYFKKLGATLEPATVSGLAGSKFIFNSSSGVQMTAFVVARGTTVFIIEETGGYQDQLIQLVGTLILT